MSVVAIVGCGSAKQAAGLHEARDLYTGSLFRAARQHVEAQAVPWAILSARWGLMSQRQVLAPYDYCMADRAREAKAAPDEHRRWMLRLGGGLMQAIQNGWLGRAAGWPDHVRLEVHAGAAYVEAVEEALAHCGERSTMGGRPVRVDIVAPLAGLQLGERLAWYARAREAA